MDTLLKEIKDICRNESLLDIDLELVESKLMSDQLQHAASVCHTITLHPDYDILAARLELAHLYYTTLPRFEDMVMAVADQLSPQFIRDCKHANAGTMIKESRDRLFTYTALKCLEHGYLLKDKNGIVIERPQHMFLRTAIQLHGTDKHLIQKTYRMLSEHAYIHATPTLVNSGKKFAQLASCFLCSSPTVENFFNFLQKCYTILSHYGGIGCYFHKIPCEQFLPYIKLLEATVNLVKSKSDITRLPNCAVYLEPSHASVLDLIELKLNSGNEDKRARGLFYALWTPDIFMQRVEQDEKWSLFDPATCPGLEQCHGDAYNQLYTEYEKQGRYVKQVHARHLLAQIAKSQIETGGPYMLYKDTCNRYSSYPLVTIEGSNLCAEIIEYSSEEETAVCNLASISLPRCVSKKTSKFNFSMLQDITKTIVQNLNAAIDTSWYPTECARESNMKHRPIGVGTQGLADVFQMMEVPFDSLEAKKLNRSIYSTIYLTAVETSNQLAKSHKKSVVKEFANHYYAITDPLLLNKISTYGLYNKVLVALMPTASTSVLLNNCESIEPFTSNFYTRRLLSGDFYQVNKHLLRKLIKCGLWNEKTRRHLLKHYGSVQELPQLSEEVKAVFKTAWEISQKTLIDLAADRTPYVDQSQSLNLFLAHPSIGQVTSMLHYGWKQGLKTGLYYLRTTPASKTIQFSILPCTDSCSA